MNEMMNEMMIERLKSLAHIKCFFDDDDENTSIDDYAGGNIDDAFNLGVTAGEVKLARDVLMALNIRWE